MRAVLLQPQQCPDWHFLTLVCAPKQAATSAAVPPKASRNNSQLSAAVLDSPSIAIRAPLVETREDMEPKVLILHTSYTLPLCALLACMNCLGSSECQARACPRDVCYAGLE